MDATLGMDCTVFVAQIARVRHIKGMTLILVPRCYGASIRWESSRERAVAVYKKGAEMRAHGRISSPGNTIRIEYRLTRQRICRREEIRTIADVFDSNGQSAICVLMVRRLLSSLWRDGAKNHMRPHRKQRERRRFHETLYRQEHVWRTLSVWSDTMLPISREMTDAEIDRMVEDSS
jgi:hypothetical protein